MLCVVDLVTLWYLQGPLCSFLTGALFTKRLLESLPHFGIAQALPEAQQYDDTNLVWVLASICSAGQKSRAGVHHYIHQGGAENSLQPRCGAQGGSLQRRIWHESPGEGTLQWSWNVLFPLFPSFPNSAKCIPLIIRV